MWLPWPSGEWAAPHPSLNLKHSWRLLKTWRSQIPAFRPKRLMSFLIQQKTLMTICLKIATPGQDFTVCCEMCDLTGLKPDWVVPGCIKAERGAADVSGLTNTFYGLHSAYPGGLNQRPSDKRQTKDFQPLSKNLFKSFHFVRGLAAAAATHRRVSNFLRSHTPTLGMLRLRQRIEAEPCRRLSLQINRRRIN